MKKQTVVLETIAATNTLLSAIQNKTDPDTNSWDKWTEALLREVLVHASQRTHAQGLEDLERATLTLIITAPRDDATIIKNLQQFVVDLQHITIPDGNQAIEWEPPFDGLTYTLINN